MKRREIHGISSGNTIRRTTTQVYHHRKGVLCPGVGCWWVSLCMHAKTKWSYSSRKNNRIFHEGFNGRKTHLCSHHGHRMCHEPIPIDKRNKKSLRTGLNLDDYDPDLHNHRTTQYPYCRGLYDSGIMEGVDSCNEEKEEITEDLENLEEEEETYEEEEFDTYEDESVNEDVYTEYEKMRSEEVDLDTAYAAYEKMKDDTWVILTENAYTEVEN